MNYNDNLPKAESISPGYVFNKRYGYIQPDRLERKLIAKSVSSVSLAAVIMFLSMLLISVIFAFLFYITDISATIATNGYTEALYYGINWLATVIPVGAVFFAAAKIIKMPLNLAIKVNRVKISDAFLLITSATSICLLANFPAQWFGKLLEAIGIHSESTSMILPNTTVGMILCFVTTALLPAVFEEFAFRGVVLGSLRRYGDIFALIVSSVIFGSVHMSLVSFPFAFLCGLALGYIYILSGNIWINVLVHFINNAISVILSLTAAETVTMSSILINVLLFYGIIIIGIISLIILIAKKKLPRRLNKPNMISTFGDKLQCSVVNPGFILLIFTFVVYVTLNVLGAN